MIIVTTIDVPDYVYEFFQKEAEPWKRKTAEDMMAGYPARHVRRTLESQEKKAQKEIEKTAGCEFPQPAVCYSRSRTTSLATR